MLILPGFVFEIPVDAPDIKSITMKLDPVPVDYRVGVGRAQMMYQYSLYAKLWDSSDLVKKGIVWLTDKEIDALRVCKEDCIEFLNKFIDCVMGFKPYKVEENEQTNQEKT